jgi:flagellar protein FlgJ
MNVTNFSANQFENYKNNYDKTEKVLSDLKATAEIDTNKMNAQELKTVREKCQEFETIFIKMMFEEMRKSLKPPASGSKALDQGKDIFNEMLYEQYAKSLSREGGIGLGDMIYKQLSTPKIPAAEVIKRYNNF